MKLDVEKTSYIVNLLQISDLFKIKKISTGEIKPLKKGRTRKLSKRDQNWIIRNNWKYKN